MVDIKKFIKRKAKAWKEKSAEAKKYREELKKKVKVAQRKAFAAESVKRAAESAKRRAREVYSPTAKRGLYDAPISPALEQLAFGTTPTPKQVVQKVLKGKKKKKGKKRKVSHVQPTVQIPANKIDDLVWKY